MTAPTIVVGVDRDGRTERVEVTAVRVERDRDGTVRCYDGDGTEIATFYQASYAVRKDNLAE
jgi:hypothetical protein